MARLRTFQHSKAGVHPATATLPLVFDRGGINSSPIDLCSGIELGQVLGVDAVLGLHGNVGGEELVAELLGVHVGELVDSVHCTSSGLSLGLVPLLDDSQVLDEDLDYSFETVIFEETFAEFGRGVPAEDSLKLCETFLT